MGEIMLHAVRTEEVIESVESKTNTKGDVISS